MTCSAVPRRGLVLVGADLGLRIQMFEGPWLDTGSADEGIHLMLLQADHTTELVRGDQTLVDELVQRSERNAQTLCSIGGAEPVDVRGRHSARLALSRRECPWRQ
jgi:hypothetical protein